MRSPRLVNDVFLQAGSRYVAVALQLVRGVVLAALLGPLGMGTVAAVLVILAWAVYSDLGVGEAAMRELPLAVGEGDRERQAAWRWYAVAAKVTGALVVGIGILAVAIFAGDSLAPDFRFGMITASVVIVFQQFVSGQQLVMLALRRFGAAAALIILLPALSLTLGILGAVVADVRGVFVGQLLAYIGTAGVALALMGVPQRRGLADTRARDLIALGLPYMLLSFTFYNLVYLDQVMTGFLLGREALGIYVLAQYAGTALLLLPQALAVTMGPRLLSRYGADPRPEAIAGHTWRPTQALSILLPPMIVLAWFVGPPLIHALLPEFVAAVPPLLIYSTAVFFLGLNMGASTTLFAFDRYRRNIPVIVAAIGLNVAVDLVFVLGLDMGIEGIALGSLCAYITYWLMHTRLVATCYRMSIVDTLQRLLVYGWPGLALCVVLVAFATAGVLSDPPLWAVATALAGMLLVSGARLRRAVGRGGLRKYLSGMAT